MPPNSVCGREGAFDMYGSKFSRKFMAQRYEKMLQADQLVLSESSYVSAIHQYDGLLAGHDGMSHLLEAEILLKRCRASYQFASMLKNRPASMSEKEALFAEDPENIAMQGLKAAEKAKELYSRALGTVYELQGDISTLLNNATDAEIAYKHASKLTHDDEQDKNVSPDQKTKSKEKSNQTERKLTMDDDLECLVCMKLLYEPVSTPCGHTFCRPCFQRTLDHTPSCPMCRRQFYAGFDLPVNTVMKNVLERSFPKEYQIRREEEMLSGTTAERPTALPLFVMSPMIPGEVMTMNIFEPRYRLMIRRVMEGNKRFGMIVADRHHRLASVGTEVEMTEIERIPDGRYLIDILGTRRFRVNEDTVSEVDGYRVAIPEYFKDDPINEEDAEHAQALCSEVQGIVERWMDRLSQLAATRPVTQQLLRHLGREPSMSDLEKYSFWVCSTVIPFIQGQDAKQKLISTTCTVDRFEMARQMLLAAEYHTHDERCVIS